MYKNKRWDKQNLLVRNLTFGLFILLYIGLGVTVRSLIGGVLFVGIMFYWMRQNPDTMFRVVDGVRYKALDSHFRTLFEQNNILFQYGTEGNNYFYAFDGYDLKLEVSQHARSIDEPEDIYRRAAELRLGKLVGGNRPFAEHLAILIDEMLANNFENQ